MAFAKSLVYTKPSCGLIHAHAPFELFLRKAVNGNIIKVTPENAPSFDTCVQVKVFIQVCMHYTLA